MYKLKLVNFQMCYQFHKLEDAITKMSASGFTSELYKECTRCGSGITHLIAEYHPINGFKGNPETQTLYRRITCE